MVWFLLPLAALCLWGVRFSGKGFHADYIAPASSTAVNGVFTVLVLMHHIQSSGAYAGAGIWDDLLIRYIHLSQLIVVPFLFFSGYGVAESLKNKPGYLLSMPKNRIAKTWLHLTLSLVPYFLLNLILGEKMGVAQVLLSTVGWDSLGNSNWFMFVILALYVLTFLSYLLAKQKKIPSAVLLSVLTCLLTAALIAAGKESYWWNTAVFFPLGVWYSYLKDKIEAILQKSNKTYWCFLALFAVLFVGAHLLFCKTQKIFFFMADGCFMMAFLLTGLMKFKIGNHVLLWLGKNLFGVYILQRLPMRLFEHFSISLNPYLYTVLVAACALLLALFVFFFLVFRHKEQGFLKTVKRKEIIIFTLPSRP